MTARNGVNYSYTAAYPHAVTLLGNGKSYQYDAAGNQTHRRYVGGGGTHYTDTLHYDGENRLTEIDFGDTFAPSASYAYDGDGNRVRSTIDGLTTLYPNAFIEYRVNSNTLVKYYHADGQRIAMREGSSTLYFFVSDHLGSTALTLNQNGTVHSETRYKPFGDTAWSSAPAAPTRRRYTGQLQDFDLPQMQLYFYNARYYDPALARFTQADSIVPGLGNPQKLNRYSYVLNNPMGYVDPTGHSAQDTGSCTTDWCWQDRWYQAHGYYYNSSTGHWDIAGTPTFFDKGIAASVLGEAGINVVNLNDWAFNEIALVAGATLDLASKVGGMAQLKKLLTTSASPFVDEVRVNLHRMSTYADCTLDAGACVLPVTYIFEGGYGDRKRIAVKDILVLDRLYESARSWQSPIFGKGQFVHELAHVIDFNWNFSISFPQQGFQTSYQVGNTAGEYWAEAVAVWVYPTYGRSEITHKYVIGHNGPWLIGSLRARQRLFLTTNLGGQP